MKNLIVIAVSILLLCACNGTSVTGEVRQRAIEVQEIVKEGNFTSSHGHIYCYTEADSHSGWTKIFDFEFKGDMPGITGKFQEIQRMAESKTIYSTTGNVVLMSDKHEIRLINFDISTKLEIKKD